MVTLPEEPAVNTAGIAPYASPGTENVPPEMDQSRLVIRGPLSNRSCQPLRYAALPVEYEPTLAGASTLGDSSRGLACCHEPERPRYCPSELQRSCWTTDQPSTPADGRRNVICFVPCPERSSPPSISHWYVRSGGAVRLE